ncbi:uncharacterized protein CIMG_09829 [Coccidioides immitis RS]|uniref:Nucleotidyl transferase AbiEii/AbiGii toxin family protein n=2 Tax=Coccidioides immitis TaxID=5501 RepID=J3K389_COCIM|nr:uncharacterized protein CIMG_09829 [Coccidioides immitis RS]EAS28625.3 hypothetical protein CIMG_09829 [Coccidioides immitis RS]KMU90603.1 hypothetical protein CIHG_08319 [Coccidioides immitis H538.4]
MARSLSPHQLQTVVLGLAQKLDSLNVDYAIMGGAAVCLLTQRPDRETEDVDFVIHVDHRMITADRLTSQLLTSFPSEFGHVSQFGHTIPAYKLSLPGGAIRLVELERPQYNLQSATRTTRSINGYPVKTFGPEWIMREKILSQYQRQGSGKEGTDIRDVTLLAPLCSPGKAELDFNNSKELQNALSNLVQKRPTLSELLKQKIKCAAIFQN